MPKRLIAAVLLLTLCCCQKNNSTKPNQPSPPRTQSLNPRLLSVTRIWDAAPHNAFTDLVRFNNHFYCAFREGSGHVPGTDGSIRILRSPDGQTWTAVAHIKKEGVDLRDAKLSVTPDARLMLLMGGSVYVPDPAQPNRKKRTDLRSRVAFSGDGEHWTAPQDVLDHEQWLWRLTWHKGGGYGVAYSTAPGADQWALTLHRTADGLLYQPVTKLNVTGKPNECTVRFLPDDTMVILARREAPDRNARIGTAPPPYTNWTWHDAARPVQGPEFIVLPDGQMLYAGRDYPDGKTPKTVFGRLTLQAAQPLITLPSGGDTSYPGMALAGDDTLLMSYYSSHEGKAAIYLARIALR